MESIISTFSAMERQTGFQQSRHHASLRPADPATNGGCVCEDEPWYGDDGMRSGTVGAASLSRQRVWQTSMQHTEHSVWHQAAASGYQPPASRLDWAAPPRQLHCLADWQTAVACHGLTPRGFGASLRARLRACCSLPGLRL